MTKTEYQELLRNNVLLVNFIKKDGSIRTLKCTLKQEYMDVFKGSTGSTRKVPEHQVCCIDLDINEFRSFTTDSVINYQIL